MYLGLDLGTSSVKAMLIDDAQQVIGVGHAAMTVQRPHPGWSEQAPGDWLRATEEAVAALKASHPKELAAVKGIGLSGHMHGATLIDAKDRVLRPCILWNDTRSHAEAASLDADPRFRALTGNIVFPGFTAPKLAWVKNNEPDTFGKVAKVLLPKDYLRLWLTGEYLSDMSDSAGTSWLDTAKRAWSSELLEATGLTVEQMPGLVEGTDRAGTLRAELAEKWGWAPASLSPVGQGTMRPPPVAWGPLRKAKPSSRSGHRACCLPPTPPICRSRKVPCTPSATLCPRPGTRWASSFRPLTR